MLGLVCVGLIFIVVMQMLRIAYLKNKIGFFDIAEIIEKVLNCFSPRGEVSAEAIKKTDAEVKKFTASLTAEI